MQSNASDAWFIDFGTTTHLTHNSGWIKNFEKSSSHSFGIANGMKLQSIGSETVEIPLSTSHVMNAHDVVHVPVT